MNRQKSGNPSKKERKIELIYFLNEYQNKGGKLFFNPHDLSLGDLELEYARVINKKKNLESSRRKAQLTSTIFQIVDCYENLDFRSLVWDMKSPDEKDSIPEDDCCICLTPLSSQKCLIFSKCSHWIHKDCEKERRSIQKDDSCPLCRTNVEIYKPNSDVRKMANILVAVLTLKKD